MFSANSFLDTISQVHRSVPIPFAFKRTAYGAQLNGYALHWCGRSDLGCWLNAGGYQSDGDEVPLLRCHQGSEQLGTCKLAPDAEGVYVTAEIHTENLGIIGALQSFHLDAFSADIQVAAGGVQRSRGEPYALSDWSVAAVSMVEKRPRWQRAQTDSGPVSLRSKGELIDLLRSSGMARAAAERIAAGGWDALSTAILPNSPSLVAALDALADKVKGSI